MSVVSSKETVPEVTIRKFLFSKGIRYRKNFSRLPGKPDIVITRLKIVIFVHGCFWHQHAGCRAAKLPFSNKDFWMKKFELNTQRDKRIVCELQNLGWHVIIIWECEVKAVARRTLRLAKLEQDINAIKGVSDKSLTEL